MGFYHGSGGFLSQWWWVLIDCKIWVLVVVDVYDGW